MIPSEELPLYVLLIVYLLIAGYYIGKYSKRKKQKSLKKEKENEASC